MRRSPSEAHRSSATAAGRRRRREPTRSRPANMAPAPAARSLFGSSSGRQAESSLTSARLPWSVAFCGNHDSGTRPLTDSTCAAWCAGPLPPIRLGKRGCRPSRAPLRPCGAAHERAGLASIVLHTKEGEGPLSRPLALLSTRQPRIQEREPRPLHPPCAASGSRTQRARQRPRRQRRRRQPH
jgi:hypothetical protein